MATVTGLTAARMLEIEAASVVDGEVVSGNLILTTHGGTNINAGSVIGPTGPQGPVGPQAVSAIPGEIKMWPGGALPDPAQYGKWVWADGAVYVVATYPKAAANIAAAWRTFAGASDPGAANFRVPDLRGLSPVGMDAMPGGARANRMTRAVAITLAGRTGEETHIITLPESPAHNHPISVSLGDPTHAHAIYDPTHGHYIDTFTHSYVAQVSVAAGIDVGVTNAMTNDHASYPNNPNVGYGKAVGTGISIYGAGTGVYVSAASSGNAGGGGAHENVQPTVFVPYIICLSG